MTRKLAVLAAVAAAVVLWAIRAWLLTTLATPAGAMVMVVSGLGFVHDQLHGG